MRRFGRRVLRSWPDLLRPNSWPGRREAAMRPDHHESPQPAIGPGPWRAYAQSGCDMPWDGASLSGSRPRDGQGDGVSASDAASPQARMRHPYPARGCDGLGVVACVGGSRPARHVARRNWSERDDFRLKFRLMWALTRACRGRRVVGVGRKVRFGRVRCGCRCVAGRWM